jgi:hypothetical protein
MDGFHAPSVSEDEGDVMVAAGIGEPVPAVHALAGDEEAVAEGGDGAEEVVRAGGEVFGEDDLAVVVEHDDEDGPGVQIDASVKSGVGRGVKGTHAEGLLVAGRGEVPPPMIAGKAFMSIQALHLTAAALLEFGVPKYHLPPQSGELLRLAIQHA